MDLEEGIAIKIASEGIFANGSGSRMANSLRVSEPSPNMMDKSSKKEGA